MTGTSSSAKTIDQARDPERQIAIEKALAGLVIAGGVAADREFLLDRRRKLSRARERGRLAVNLGRRLDQQVGQRRVQILARDQLDRRRDQVQVARGNIAAEVDGSHGQLEPFR